VQADDATTKARVKISVSDHEAFWRSLLPQEDPDDDLADVELIRPVERRRASEVNRVLDILADLERQRRRHP
jgi:hypothetical protein